MNKTFPMKNIVILRAIPNQDNIVVSIFCTVFLQKFPKPSIKDVIYSKFSLI